MDRRHFVAGLTAAVLGVDAARAQPQTPLMQQLALFVPTPTGGGWDNIARAMSAALTDERLVGTIDLINRPDGAAPGLREFVDRYKGWSDALLIAGAGMIGASIMARSPVDLGSLTAISRLTTEYMVVAVAPDSTYFTLPDLIAALRQNPADVPCSGGVLGSTDHLLAGMIMRVAGLDGRQLVYRPYVGGVGSARDVMDGAASFMSAGLSEMQPYIAAGLVKPLAISSSQRLPGVGIPTFVEQGADIVLANWRGVFAPKDISAEQAALLRQVIERMTRGMSWQAALFQYNWSSYYLTGDAFTAFVREETSRVRKLLAELGLT